MQLWPQDGPFKRPGNTRPIASAAGVNLGPRGPAESARQPIHDVQRVIERRFGVRRLARRPRHEFGHQRLRGGRRIDPAISCVPASVDCCSLTSPRSSVIKGSMSRNAQEVPDRDGVQFRFCCFRSSLSPEADSNRRVNHLKVGGGRSPRLRIGRAS